MVARLLVGSFFPDFNHNLVAYHPNGSLVGPDGHIGIFLALNRIKVFLIGKVFGIYHVAVAEDEGQHGNLSVHDSS